MNRVTLTNGGIEIDEDGRADLSSNVHNGMIQIAIGEGYSGLAGYERYLDFRLSKEEAIAFADWLATAIAMLP